MNKVSLHSSSIRRPAPQRRTVLIALGLALATLAAFWRVLTCGFVIYDDPAYVSENPAVQAGLGLAGLTWAFTHTVTGNWHPLTMLSHMLDRSLFGSNPAGHHLTSLFLHTLNVVLLFVLLQFATGATWRSALVAGLFGLHPLHVESVAWVSERKDVLSGSFFLLTLLAYVGYVRARRKVTAHPCPSPKGEGKHRTRWTSPCRPLKGPARRATLFYVLGLVLFTLGLMCKPMLVTLPFVLLLLDYWPERRLDYTVPPKGRFLPDLRRLFLEKIPFFALSAGFCVVTFLTQRQDGAVLTLQDRPLAVRLGNAGVGCLAYFARMFWPAKLAVYYLIPRDGWPAWQIGWGVLLVAGGSLCALWLMRDRRWPFITVGWFWFLGMLVPVLGIVQVGLQAFADRYTYLPLIGCFIALVWAGAELASRWRIPPKGSLASAALIVAALGVRTSLQTACWKNSEALFSHCAAVTKDNFVAEGNLAAALIKEDRFEEARPHCEAALAVNPQFAPALENMGIILTMAGDFDHARSFLNQAATNAPGAELRFLKLATLLQDEGKLKPAIEYYRDFLRIRPDDDKACNNLAWLLATAPDPALRNGTQAVALAEHACELTHQEKPMLLGTLAAAYAEASRFQDAVRTAKAAADLADAHGLSELGQRNRALLRLYQAGRPFHQEK